MDKYDKVLTNPTLTGSVHRVSHYLCSTTQPNALGHDFRSYASGEHMSTRLRTEITAYQLCVLDDATVESPHACVGQVLNRSSRSSVAWWSATIRLDQNISARRSLQLLARGRFTTLYKSWKALGQHIGRKYSRLTPKRITTTAFLQEVYRTGPHSRLDWSHLGLKVPVVPDAPVTKTVSIAIREVQIDYMRRVCLPGQCFTVPTDTAFADLDDIAAKGGQSTHFTQEPICFQVVSTDVTKKRHVHTVSMVEIRRMHVPIVIQRFSAWNLRHWPCSQLEVP